MDRISINNNPCPWMKETKNALKILSLNCAGLKAHFRDIQTDDRLRKADIVHLVETSLMNDDDDDAFKMTGYKHKLIKNGKGKGIATYFLEGKFQHKEDIKTNKFQMTKFRHDTLDIINVYRSQSGHSLEVLDHLNKLIDLERTTMITGDFNICFNENFNNRMIQGLLHLEFDQMVHEPTHILGRHIDHAYLRDPSNKIKPIIDRYSPYYSDHDAICITIPEMVSESEME